MKIKIVTPRKTRSYKIPHNSPPDVEKAGKEAAKDDKRDDSMIDRTTKCSEARAAYNAALLKDPTCSKETCKAARAAWKLACKGI